jgi:hypothetical protein
MCEQLPGQSEEKNLLQPNLQQGSLPIHVGQKLSNQKVGVHLRHRRTLEKM